MYLDDEGDGSENIDDADMDEGPSIVVRSTREQIEFFSA